MRRLLRAGAAVALGVLTSLAAPLPASAHAYLARSAPADGAVLDRAPEALTLTFTERVELSAARISIVDGDGRHWAVTSLAVRSAEPAAPAATAVSGTESPVELVAGLPALPANTYHVSWHTLSSDDLHTTSGTLVFGVQRAVVAAGTPGPAAPGPRESALRGLGLLGMATLLGGAALALLLARVAGRGRSADPSGLRRRLLLVSVGGGLVALLTAPAQLLVQVSDGSGGRRLFVDQLTSGRWLLRELGLATLVAAVLWAGRRSSAGPPGTDGSGTDPSGPDRSGTGRSGPVVLVGAAGAACAAAGTALLGHPMGGPVATVLTGAVHVLAAGGWAGSVLAAALALLPVLRTGPDRAGQVRMLLHAFAPLAIGCLTALALTGLLMTGVQVSTVDALLATPYGLLLLGKLTAVVVAGLLGLRTARRLRSTAVRAGGGVPRRGLVAEAVALAGVLVLAGTLAAAGPARGPRFPVGAPAKAAPEVSGQVADLVDTVTVRPNRPGRNVVTITVSDTRRPAPGPVTGVSVLLTGPDGNRTVHPVTRTGDGWTVTVDDIRSAGDWRVAVTVLRDGLSPVTDNHPWVVPATDVGPTAAAVSSAPLRPAINGLVALIAVGALLAVLLIGRRRLRGRRTGAGPAGVDPGGSAEQGDQAAPPVRSEEAEPAQALV